MDDLLGQAVSVVEGADGRRVETRGWGHPNHYINSIAVFDFSWN
jgi:hypothetical protein